MRVSIAPVYLRPGGRPADDARGRPAHAWRPPLPGGEQRHRHAGERDARRSARARAARAGRTSPRTAAIVPPCAHVTEAMATGPTLIAAASATKAIGVEDPRNRGAARQGPRQPAGRRAGARPARARPSCRGGRRRRAPPDAARPASTNSSIVTEKSADESSAQPAPAVARLRRTRASRRRPHPVVRPCARPRARGATVGPEDLLLRRPLDRRHQAAGDGQRQADQGEPGQRLALDDHDHGDEAAAQRRERGDHRQVALDEAAQQSAKARGLADPAEPWRSRRRATPRSRWAGR